MKKSTGGKEQSRGVLEVCGGRFLEYLSDKGLDAAAAAAALLVVARAIRGALFTCP